MEKQGFQWHPVIDESKCIGCRSCINTCGKDCLGFDEIRMVAYVKAPFDCIPEFRTCEARCPAGAISFPDEEEYFVYVNQRLLRLEAAFGPRGADLSNNDSPETPTPCLPPSAEKTIDKPGQ